ncbi:hypothetical protein BpHYR1_023254 [Brachionus plicatilis]|uniref:Uncharacterized protein n=1 Tax=Brachionus plicatilis TaxID=10195 RepID=A0A3M7Q3X6_BRAPC|nr:hypothetical protein BpHYR1_023254 [Brachionus plicatilis]
MLDIFMNRKFCLTLYVENNLDKIKKSILTTCSKHFETSSEATDTQTYEKPSRQTRNIYLTGSTSRSTDIKRSSRGRLETMRQIHRKFLTQALALAHKIKKLLSKSISIFFLTVYLIYECITNLHK